VREYVDAMWQEWYRYLRDVLTNWCNIGLTVWAAVEQLSCLYTLTSTVLYVIIIYTGRSVAHSKIARIARVVFVLYVVGRAS